MRSPLFLFLLPVFFVFHGYSEHFRNISFIDCIPLIGLYLLASLTVFLPARLLLKDNTRAALIATFIMSFYFFFGALHDFLRVHAFFLHKYSFLLPLFAAITIGIFIYLKKRKPSFPRLPLYLNTLLLLYLLVDGISLAAGLAGKTSSRPRNYTIAGAELSSCDTCAKPDIYFLLFDGYNSTKSLKEYYHYDNSALDSFLLSEGFQIQRNSRSNYFATIFSMTSMFNLSYLQDLKDPEHIRSDDFTNQFVPLRNNIVTRYLAGQGYTIVNNSIFDIKDNPSPIDHPFIPSKTRLITERTLINYLVRDLGKWYEEHLGDPRKPVLDTWHANDRLFDLTIAETKKQRPKPRFVYTHLVMPHFPYVFDSLQHLRDPMEVGLELEYLRPNQYLNYIPYTNTHVRDLISTIKKNTAGRAVIIFMSDHGFRYNPKEGPDFNVFFKNQNAIYFPDHDYRGFYDSISAVNEFRVLFNRMFGQRLPMLVDSTIILRQIF